MKKVDIDKIWSKIDSIMKKIFSDEEYIKCVYMFEQIGERFLTAPASPRESYHCCFPGGLAFHTLNICNFMFDLVGIYKIDAPIESVLKVSLFANLGKIGGTEDGEDLFIMNDSDWHKKNGILYSYNENLTYMHYCARSLNILQHFGISLTEQEFAAIYYLKEQEDSRDASAPFQSNDLGFLLFAANILAAKKCQKNA